VSWTSAAGFEKIADNAAVYGINRDGSIAVGLLIIAGETSAARWDLRSHETATLTESSYASSTNDDGSVVVGELGTGETRRAFRWQVGEAAVSLGTLPGGEISSATSVNGAGDVIVGWSDTPMGIRAFRWTAAGMADLGVTSNTEHTLAYGVSRNGQVVVGNAFSFGPVGDRSFLWSEQAGIKDPGVLPSFKGAMLGRTDATGSTAIGWSFRQDNGMSVSEAELWDQAHGLRALFDVLTAAGAEVEGWKLSGVAGISDDGKVLGGTGYNPQGIAEPWIAHLP